MKKGYVIKDSGKRQKFQTGAIRDITEQKGDFSLLPARTIALLALHFQQGAKKYQKRNWEKGMPLSKYADSGLRHFFQFLQGKTDENHLISSIWNLVCLCDTKERINEGLLPKELDDLPKLPKKFK